MSSVLGRSISEKSVVDTMVLPGYRLACNGFRWWRAIRCRRWRRASACVLGREDVCGAFADDDAGGHGVAGGYPGHDRPVGDAKGFYSIDFQLAVDDRHGVSAHFGGAGLVPVARGCVADEVLKLGTCQLAGRDFALGERPQCGGVAYLAA